MKSTLKTVYIDKIKLLNKYSEHYYQKNNPLVTDQQFDNLKKEILELEKKYKFLTDKNSPNNSVGFKPSKSFAKYKHKLPMLSLSNAFNEEDLKNFEKKIFNYLNKNLKLEYSVEPKIDGISASLTYRKKKLVAGVSRGDGKIGEVITENLKTIKDIPLEIKISSKALAKLDKNPKSIEIKNVVPNVSGLSEEDATKVLEKVGLNVEVRGDGKVKSQSIEPGTKVEYNQKILIKLT